MTGAPSFQIRISYSRTGAGTAAAASRFVDPGNDGSAAAFLPAAWPFASTLAATPALMINAPTSKLVGLPTIMPLSEFVTRVATEAETTPAAGPRGGQLAAALAVN